jgi:uncharacterized repeat protein (TIGR03803 family)
MEPLLMHQKKHSAAPVKALIAVAVALVLVSSASAGGKYKVLHAFTGGKDGGGLWGSLAFDTKGNLYGTTSGGGDGQGTVFELTPGSKGRWTEAVLHSFPSFTDDGQGPTSSLALDEEDNLYGTTAGGGNHHSGVVFELAHDSWAESILYNFCAKPKCSDGGSPYAGLVFDKSSNLYGTGYAAFELSPGSDGWKEVALHDFTGEHGDGEEPLAGLILDAAGNVYGTAEDGGNNSLCSGGCGIVYQLTPGPDGKWAETVLHRFGSFQNDGRRPGVGALIMDGSGSLYGTTTGGGAFSSSCSCGTVFKLTPGSDGKWKETILHSFTLGTGGEGPSAGVVMDKAGNLYGTTSAGGAASCGCGLVYKLAPGSNGKWTYTVLHRFTGADGAGPNANLILDGQGNLYGTTTTGGAGGYGVAFELTP